MLTRSHLWSRAWLAAAAGAVLLGAGLLRAGAESAAEAPRTPPTRGPIPEQLAEPPSETRPVTPSPHERTGSGKLDLEERTPEDIARPEGPVVFPKRPAVPHGAPKEIR